MQLWASRPLGCSGLVALAAVHEIDTVENRRPMSTASSLEMPSSVWVVAEATAELVVEMLHDAVQSAARGSRVIDIDALVAQAERAIRDDDL